MQAPSKVAKSPSVSPRAKCAAWAWLLMAFAGCMGCFGGQTGTELAPDTREDDKSNSENGNIGGSEDSGGSKGSGVDTSSPTAMGVACDGSEAALSQFASDTGVSATAVSEFVSRVNPFTLTSSDGAGRSATLEVTIQPGTCVISDAAGRGLRVPAKLVISSTDGWMRVTLLTTITAVPKSQGGVARLELEASAECDATCTLWIDTSGYTGVRSSLSARLQAFGAGVQLLGQMTVWGRSNADCVVKECPAPQWLPISEIYLSRID